MQTIPGGVNSWYVDSVVVSKRVLELFFIVGIFVAKVTQRN
jgi:hypothetical protein